MSTKEKIRIGPLRQSEVPEAARIARLAFGTFLGLPNPLEFMGDRDLVIPRWRSSHVKFVAARDGDRLIGSNAATRWGSFGFFGPLTVLPEYWDRGVAQRLLEATMKVFEKWGVRHTGLCTFPQSAKHIGLYQKFGYWPQYLTPIMMRTPEAMQQTAGKDALALLSGQSRSRREEIIRACGRLTHKILKGLDLGDEIRSVLKQHIGDVVLIFTRGDLDGFAVCMNGPGSEGGEKLCFVKFAAARGGAGAGERFSRLLVAIDTFALSRGVSIEAGVNLAREGAFTRMRAHGYRTAMNVVAMQRPHTAGFNRPDVYVMDDWR
jgi:GNAT superfamily N-acetyltransferase